MRLPVILLGKNMRYIILILSTLFTNAHADTIDHYMNIVNNIPKMEVQADPQSQAWARSARNILALTSESIAESLLLANESATSAGTPLFCLPQNTQLTPQVMNDLIQQTYSELSSQQSGQNKMTVSQVALLGMSKRFPCQPKIPKSNQFNQAVSQIGIGH